MQPRARLAGEYEPQTGFGWSNGVALRLLSKYGRVLELTHGDERADGRFVQHPLLEGWAAQRLTPRPDPPGADPHTAPRASLRSVPSPH